MYDERDINNVLKLLLPLLDKQNKKGMNEYGVALKDANLSTNELLNHGIEELVDLLQYLTVLKSTIETEITGEKDAVYNIKLSDDDSWYLSKQSDEGFSIGMKQRGLRMHHSEFTIDEIQNLPKDIKLLLKQKHLVKVEG